ncbi:MAG TPA: DUF6328 family protein [Actinomycetaceae bacterium]|nr:DUF6328 family protein [Actinomycetaceae bacterium]
MSNGQGESTTPDRREDPGERLDRQWNELLQELRVVQTGVQLLAGFLLILPFQDRFEDLTDNLRLLYLIAVAAGSLAVFFVLAPVVMHRVLFQSHRKDVLVRMGDRLAQAGLGLVAVTVIGVAALTFGVVLGEIAAIVAGTVAAIVCVGLWWGLAHWLARRPASSSYHPGPDTVGETETNGGPGGGN